MTKRLSMQKGFTLVEMAFVLLIMGLIVGAFFSFLSVQHEEDAQQITAMREQKIANALTYYAQMQNHLPCPAQPKPGTGILPGQEEATCTTTTSLNGIVPYRTLGLTKAEIIDGYNNPISYTVSAEAAKPPSSGNVEYTCKLPAWVPGATNVNVSKAYFCCQQVTSPSTKLRVFTDAADTQPAAQMQQNTQFGAINTQVGATNPGVSISYYAYVLVSHGKNGYGSFTLCDNPAASSCNNTRTLTTNAGAQEKINALNTDLRRYDLPRSSNGSATDFDDVVLWRTQDRVISELNNDSCGRP